MVSESIKNKINIPLNEVGFSEKDQELSTISYDRGIGSADIGSGGLGPNATFTKSTSKKDDETVDGASVIENNVFEVLRQEENRRRSMAVWGMSDGQRLATFLSHLLALASIIVVLFWTNEKEMGGGGVSWSKLQRPRVFNWHPIMMVAMHAFMTISLLSSRVRSIKSNRKHVRVIHVLQMSIAFLCCCFGLAAVMRSHNDETIDLMSNFRSLHSLVGFTIVIIFCAQFTLSFAVFGGKISCINVSKRRRLLSFHRVTGGLIYVTVTSNIFMGVTEKQFMIGCSRDDSISRGAKDYDISNACKLGNSLGMIVLFMTLITKYALYNFPEYEDGNRPTEQTAKITEADLEKRFALPTLRRMSTLGSASVAGKKGSKRGAISKEEMCGDTAMNLLMP